MEEEPFGTTADAVIWGLRAMSARLRGERPPGITTARPCLPEDILRAIDHQRRQRRFTATHLDVLDRWALRGLAPSRVDLRDAPDRRVWDDVMRALAPGLIRRGIVRAAGTNRGRPA